MSYFPLSDSPPQEFRQIADEFDRRNLVREFSALHVAPVRPRDGMLAYADGTDWDPGSGEGLYFYYASAWHLAESAGASGLSQSQVLTLGLGA